MDATRPPVENASDTAPNEAGTSRWLLWKAARIVLMGAVVVGLLILLVFLVLAGLAIADGKGELFVRAGVGAVVSATMVWLMGHAARLAGHRVTDLVVARYTAAIRLDPHDAIGHLQRGLAHAQRREYAKAIAHFDAAIRLDPLTQPNAYIGRVNAYGGLGQLDRVITDYSEIIQGDPTHALAYGARATAYNALGRWDLSIPDATEAIRLAPAQYLGYDARGYGYYQRGSFNWGVKLMAIAWMLATLGFLRGEHFKWRTPTGTRADFNQAVADFTEAIRLNPAAWDCYAGRAMAYRSLGEHAKAAADIAARGPPAR
jgi:tetratricopeptide (TPR) repeat protein